MREVNTVKDETESKRWLLCPVCQSKTRTMLRRDTTLRNFPLFCPKCKREILINLQNEEITVIREPDAQTQSR